MNTNTSINSKSFKSVVDQVGVQNQMGVDEMNEKIDKIVDALKGLKRCEWLRVKQHVDMVYNSKAAKVELDDLELLKKNLKREFKDC